MTPSIMMPQPGFAAAVPTPPPVMMRRAYNSNCAGACVSVLGVLFLTVGLTWIVLYIVLMGVHTELPKTFDSVHMLLYMTTWLNVFISGLSLAGLGCVALYVSPCRYRMVCTEDNWLDV